MTAGQDIQNDYDSADHARSAPADNVRQPTRLQKWWGTVRSGRLIAIGIAAAFVALWLFGVLFPPPQPLNQNDIDQSIAIAMASATPPPSRASQVYDIILPSLVYVQTNRAQGETFEDDADVGVGSGVIINADGSIITSLHVVAGASTIKVFFADGGEAAAEIIAVDVANDIAILLPNRLPQVTVPAVMGNPRAEAVGNEVFAVGNPLGLAGSLSAGVISGFDRTLPINEDGQELDGLIQFDAAVNPGNSGGPLLNKNGQVIGIVTALANPTQQNFFIGIGFAVPITTASQASGAPSY